MDEIERRGERAHFPLQNLNKINWLAVTPTKVLLVNETLFISSIGRTEQKFDKSVHETLPFSLNYIIVITLFLTIENINWGKKKQNWKSWKTVEKIQPQLSFKIFVSQLLAFRFLNQNILKIQLICSFRLSAGSAAVAMANSHWTDFTYSCIIYQKITIFLVELPITTLILYHTLSPNLHSCFRFVVSLCVYRNRLDVLFGRSSACTLKCNKVFYHPQILPRSPFFVPKITLSRKCNRAPEKLRHR